MADEIKTMSVKEFREQGYLSELNRRFLHPLGLALSVTLEEDGSESLHSIWDYRGDPEGMIFGEDLTGVVEANAQKIEALWKEREAARVESLGWMVQPVE